MTKIAVMLPVPYKGGTLQAAKNIAKAIQYGAQKNHQEIEVVFSYLENALYDLKDEFPDLLEAGVELRATDWETVDWDFLYGLPYSHRPKIIQHTEYCIPRDGANDFYDCDVWLIISDRLPAPLLPIKPYCLIVFDYLQRYVPGTITHEWHETVGIPVNREAEHIFVTTPPTRNDLISYIGVDPSKITMLNLDFSPPKEEWENAKPLLDEKYFLWITNLSFHKNHTRALNAIERFFEENKEFHLAITGVDTQYFLPDKDFLENDPVSNLPQVVHFRKTLSKNGALMDRVHIFGLTSDKHFTSLMRNAEFLFHSAVNDNGTFSVIEAAYYGIPTISSRYPAMEHIRKLYDLNLHWFDPFETTDITKQLEIFSENYHDVKIPPREQLLKLDWRSNADTLNDTLTKIIKRKR